MRKLAERADQLLGQIVPNIGKTSDLVQEIAAASAPRMVRSVAPGAIEELEFGRF